MKLSRRFLVLAAGWNPQQTTFEQLVQKMVDHDLKAVAHAHR